MGDVNTTSMSAASSSSAAAARHANKRYLIMTYAVEFDRVHYPLPMLHQPAPSPQALQRTVARLRQELAQARSMAAAAGGGMDASDATGDASVMGGALARLQQENQALRTQVQRLRDSLGSAQGVDREMRNALTAAETGRGKAEDALERLRNASRAEVKRLRGEVDALKQQLVHVHQAAEASSAAVTANAASDREELRSTNTKLRARVRDLLKQLSTHGIRPRGGNSVLGTPTRRSGGGGGGGLGRVAGAAGSKGRSRASPGRNSAAGSRAGSAASRGSRGRSPAGAPRGGAARGARHRTPSPVVSQRSTRYARPWLGGGSDVESVGSRGSRGSKVSRASSAGSAASLKRRHSSGKYGYDPVAYAKARQEKIDAACSKRGMTPTRKDGRPGTGPSRGGVRPGELPAYMRSPGGRSVGSAGSRASASSAFSAGSKRSARNERGTPGSRKGAKGGSKNWDRPWRSSPKAGPGSARRPGTKTGATRNESSAARAASPLRPASASSGAGAKGSEGGPSQNQWMAQPPQVQRRQAWAAQEQQQYAQPTGRMLQQPYVAKQAPPVPPEEPHLASGHGITASGAAVHLAPSASAHSFVGHSSEASFQPSVPMTAATAQPAAHTSQPSTAAAAASYAYNPATVSQQAPSDGTAEISAIDQRLQALQSFLKAAKTGQTGISPPP